MIAIDARITGTEELNRRLDRIADKIRNPIELHKRIAGYIFDTFQRNMSSGLDPKGNPLPPPARWTRLARHVSYQGKLTPLLATGGLKNAMNIWDLSNKGVMIGWKDKGYLNVAERMTKGTPGRMKIRGDKIKKLYSGLKKAKKDGHEYIRVNNDGKWITRQSSASSVMVKPIARKFFYLTKKQIDKSMSIANRFVKEAINK